MADLIYRRGQSGCCLVLGLALCVLGAIVPVHAATGGAFQSGNSLLKLCDSRVEYDVGACLAYTSGVADALSGNEIDDWRACLSEQVTQGQARDVVVKWLRAHPEKRHFAAAGLVAHALSDAFPCK